ncbi:GPI ethanolamine phosphate transferase 1-like isoform X1 [Saccostrea cucullata]|uniref:GPI ethanolamine phosphate transferase 1-like isoform X1 n=1 Tax=Saccostrea cuccullata TaxID=36930 RepID=UPI002ED16374
MRTWQLVVFGVTVHLIFFYSIFDIYFTSPLVHGMTPFTSSSNPPAKRLILFVADGLRADKFYEPLENGKFVAPFFRSVIENKGVWGVSHTRVPTESRPGHVALIAGFYEDVSAVAKGWKENPVEFDSVFNESQYTWSWGSPDILPMFSKGASGDHVFMDYYPSEHEDFAAADASKLDTWVFDKVKIFLLEANKDPALMKKLQKDKIVFFLHLLGIDTNGHSHKPFSQEYLLNIAAVDSGIQEISQLFEEFYHHDNRTAYIMTADHGMTDWGSHGAGHPSETLTPLVAWGAGIRGPRAPDHKSKPNEDGFSKKWKLDHLKRSDVQQADLSPLMAALIGVAYPVNSVGVLPLEVLDIPLPDQAEAMFANAQQILAQFKVKMEQKQRTTLSQTFRPFLELTDDKQVLHTRNIRNLIKDGLYEEAVKESQHLIQLALRGLGYYQNYDRFLLGLSITAGFVGWGFYILTLILRDHVGFSNKRTFFDEMNSPFLLSRTFIRGLAAAVAMVITVLLIVQSLPWTYYLYCLVPVLLWMLVLERWHIFVTAINKQWNTSGIPAIGTVVMCLLGLEAVVAGFFYREIFSVGFIAIGVWPFWAYRSRSTNQYAWLVICLMLSVFPLLPVVGRQSNYYLVLLAGVVALIIGAVIARVYLKDAKGAKMRLMQLTILLAAIYNLWSVSSSIKRKEGLHWFNQLVSWTILGSSILVPLLNPTHVLPRLFSIAFAFFPVYLLMSLLQEGLFIVCFCVVLYLWIQLEKDVHNTKGKNLLTTDFAVPPSGERHVVAEDIRRSLFYIFFILVAFYSTGNIASINSFEPAAVYCFLTVFNPFMMGALLMLKNILPLVLVACSFRTVQILTHIPNRALFLIVMIMSDFMALNFFFLVRDYGSWLEIGTSISHYVIVMCMNIFLMILFGVSHFLTTIQIKLKNSL